MEGDEMKEDAGRRTKEREEDRGRHDDRRKKRERNDQRDRVGAGDRQMKDRGDQEENRGDRRTETDEHEGGQGRKKQRRGHRGGGGTGSREPSALGNRDLNGKFDNFSSTNRKTRRVDEKEKEKEKQSCTIFVGDLDPMVTAEQLTSLFQKFGTVLSAKIKDNHCYGFVTFDKRDCAEAAIGAGQKEDGIPLLNNKQVYVSWALGSLPDWKKGIGGFTVSPGKQQNRPRSRKGVVKPSVLAAATAAAAAKAYAVLAGADLPSPSQDTGAFQGREIVAYDDLL